MKHIIAFANWLLVLAGVRAARQEVVTEVKAPVEDTL